MKHAILLLSFIALSWSVSAQNFAPVGAKWYYWGSANTMHGPDTTMSYILLEVEKDTSVNTQIWKKISQTTFRSVFGPATPAYYDTTYQAPIFTYESGDTIFYYNETFRRLLPLYIFNVSPGDTLTFHAPDTNCFTARDSLFRLVVDSVAVINISGQSLKQVWTQNLDQVWIPGTSTGYIERIGAPLGFLLSHECYYGIPEHQGPQLRCYADSSMSYRPPFNSAQACDYLSTSISDKRPLAWDLSVYPNPAQNSIYIHANSINYPFEVKIYDAVGHLQRKQKCETGNNCYLSLNDLVNGVYLLTIKSKERDLIINRKIVIHKN